MSTGKFNGAKSTLAAGMLALSAVFAQVAPDTAFAQGAPQQAAVQQVKVPMEDLRGIQAEGAGYVASPKSVGGLAVVVHTANSDVLEAVKAGARAAIAEGIPVRKLYLANPVAGQPDSVDIYADGALYNVGDTNYFVSRLAGNPTLAVHVTHALQSTLQQLHDEVVKEAVAGNAVAKDKR